MRPDPRPNRIAAIGAAAEAALLLVALGLGRLSGAPAFAVLRLDPAGLAAGLAATLPLLAVLAWCLRTRWRPIAELMRVVHDRVAPLFRGSGMAGLALLALLAGVAEEALFRGVLQLWLAERLPRWAALLLASGVFGALHWITATYAFLATLAGAWFGLLLLVTGNLLPPIVAHAAYDLVALLVLSRSSPHPGGPVPE
jgi:membrane protease YdiL (CAAX protease family)